MRKGLDLPDKLGNGILHVEVDRVSNSGTPIAYPAEGEKQGVFVGTDGIHLPVGEPNEVLEVEIVEFSKERAKAKLTHAERCRRKGINPPRSRHKPETGLSDKEVQKRRKRINQKSEKNEERNEEFRESLTEEISNPKSVQNEDNIIREIDDDEDNNPMDDNLIGSKNDLL